MIEQQTIIAQSFEEEKAKGRLLLLLDDIEAATKQLSSLENESESLSTKLKDLEFHLDELNLEKDLLSTPPKPLSQAENEDAEGKFFPFLNSLENRHTAALGNIEGQKQLASELGHQLSRLGQQNKKLKAEFELVESQLKAEELSLRESNDTLEDLEIQLDEKVKENEYLLKRCEDLKEELDERNDTIQNSIIAQADQLREIYREKQQQLSDIRRRSAELRGDLARLEKQQQEDLQNTKQSVKRGSQVGAWRNERAILKNKLKTLKTQYLNEQKNIESSSKRDKELQYKFAKLLGEDHNNGECELARKCIIANIEDTNAVKEAPVANKDLEYERDYTIQLEGELSRIKKSIAVFTECRENQLKALNEELDGCTQKGYIKLLREEFADIQAQLNKLH
ncbi:hypothetical protein TRFO_32581 [Tritrichomonas foetus]|uniref:Uncharacterized protein n=1 Tax=Tritrichomonas foetus TaxID=1144522 RepID=A0A1J4JT24_9EUKA|nr:hypothetical protein TRFO_32581 [Tritrichomonas foetus]|eukprot:OHT00670.1 hypothetical protein TRFO_32581 [Tritrichomonas foetus]